MEFPCDKLLTNNPMDIVDLTASDIPQTFFIDEAQFLNKACALAFCLRNPPMHTVNMYGLKNDCMRLMWPGVEVLFNEADEITKIPSYCELCHKEEANWNKRIIKDGHTKSIDIGFNFIGVCIACYYL